MARKGHTKVIYKGTFVCKQTLNGKLGHKFMSRSTNFKMQKSDCFLLGLISSIKKVYYIEYEVMKMNQQAMPPNWRK